MRMCVVLYSLYNTKSTMPIHNSLHLQICLAAKLKKSFQSLPIRFRQPIRRVNERFQINFLSLSY